MSDRQQRPAPTDDYFRRLAEELPQLLWAGPLRGPYHFVNQYCRTYTGFGAEDPADFDWRARVHAEDRERMELLLAAAEAEGRGLEAECRLSGADGVHRWFRLAASPLTDSGGAPHWVYAATEIDELRLRRDRLISDRARLNALLATSPGALVSYRLRPEGGTQMLFVSQAAERIYGFPTEEILADSSLVISRLEYDSSSRGLESMSRSLQDGLPWHAEYRYRHPKEGETWLETHFVPTRSLEGEPIWNGVVLDITKRKRSEEQLALSQVILEAALEATQMGAWVWDPITDKVWGNEALRAMWQFGDDVPLWHDAALARARIHPEDVKRVDELMALAATTGERLDFELRLRLPDGRQRWVASRARAALDPDGKVLRIFGTNQDITQQKLASENTLRTQKLEALGTLAGGIAHDFNNVLFAIQGNASLALDALEPDHPARPLLDSIDKASVRASELVGQILTFSRPQDQKLRVTEPAGPVQEAINLVRATTPSRIALDYRVEPDTPPIFADAARLVQVVVNLCTNAVHAIGKDRPGLIEVRLSKHVVTETPGIGNERIAPGTYAVLAVSDNGCGMDETTQARIFDPFFTTKPPGEGSGLGLSVVHGIVRGLGGVISVYSQPGKGSLFRLHFPASPGGRPQSVRPEAPRRAGHGQRILYVDDEEVLVQLGRGLLEGLGYTPSAHRSAEQALAAFREDPTSFGAAVTDLTMPGMSGFDLARALLALRPDLPILVVSGLLGPDERAQAEQLGIREVALKPVAMNELGEILARMCG